MGNDIPEYTLEKEFAEYKLEHMKDMIRRVLVQGYIDNAIANGHSEIISDEESKNFQEKANEGIDFLLNLSDGGQTFVVKYNQAWEILSPELP